MLSHWKNYSRASRYNLPLQMLYRKITQNLLDETTFFEDKNCQTALMATLKMAEHFDLLHSGVTQDHEWNRIKDLLLGYWV